MKIKGKQDIEYWITRTKSGKIIRVFRVDYNEANPFNKPETPFDIPIMVEYTGMAEGVADILEERQRLKEKVLNLETQLIEERRRESDRHRYESKKKKWWEIWK